MGNIYRRTVWGKSCVTLATEEEFTFALDKRGPYHKFTTSFVKEENSSNVGRSARQACQSRVPSVNLSEESRNWLCQVRGLLVLFADGFADLWAVAICQLQNSCTRNPFARGSNLTTILITLYKLMLRIPFRPCLSIHAHLMNIGSRHGTLFCSV